MVGKDDQWRAAEKCGVKAWFSFHFRPRSLPIRPSACPAPRRAIFQCGVLSLSAPGTRAQAAIAFALDGPAFAALSLSPAGVAVVPFFDAAAPIPGALAHGLFPDTPTKAAIVRLALLAGLDVVYADVPIAFVARCAALPSRLIRV